jgi:acyl-CoA synthetase (AMP-forming)/AMP-acid ligase II
MMEVPHFDSLFEPLLHWAGRRPDDTAIHFVHDDGREEVITAGQLHTRALVAGEALQKRGVSRGDIVIVVLRHSPELIDLFWGLIAIGAVPSIFPYLTEKIDPEIYTKQTRQLISNSGASLVITFPEFDSLTGGLLADTGCTVITVDEITGSACTGEIETDFSAGAEMAQLQYSSGSTGLQKGVVHSHRALLDCVHATATVNDIRTTDVCVNWLPLFHDFGLIVGLLIPVTYGIPTVLMSPFYWIRKPSRLLEVMHRHRGTICFMPNFAFNHSVRSVRDGDLKGVDLSGVRRLINGSEPVRLDTLERFTERFAPCGLEPETVAVGYGATEASGGITMTPWNRRPKVDWVDLRKLQTTGRAVPVERSAPGASPIVSCGPPMMDIELDIVDPGGKVLEDRRVGEIVVRSPRVFSEYHLAPELTEQALIDGGFRSGDLGYLSDGELYICGRKKDLIITGGRNVYPEDLDEIANKVPGIYPGRSVAFGVLDERSGSEGIVMVCELRQDSTEEQKIEIERELRGRVVGELDLPIADLHLLDQRGWVVKTTNGKIARSANRAKYLKTLSRGPFREGLAIEG